MFAEIMKK